MKEAFIKGFGATLGVLSGIIAIGVLGNILNPNSVEGSKPNNEETSKTKEEA